jgi:biopolymer transport protein ExbD
VKRAVDGNRFARPGRTPREARGEQPPVAIDMNPMVDLAFLLLTFFMLASSFNQPQAMELVLPPPPEPDEAVLEQPVKESKALTLVLGRDDRLYWYRGVTEPEVHESAYGPEGLERLLREQLAATPDLVVLVKPLDASRYANLVDALDDLGRAAAPRYALAEPGPEDLRLIEAFARTGERETPTAP